MRISSSQLCWASNRLDNRSQLVMLNWDLCNKWSLLWWIGDYAMLIINRSLLYSSVENSVNNKLYSSLICSLYQTLIWYQNLWLITIMTSSVADDSQLSPRSISLTSVTISSQKNAAASTLKNTFKTFAQQISIKLDNHNFLSWKQ